ncbi:magnesium-transporting ATPase (P-type) [Thermostichus sp. MS-CIW-26]
MAKSVSPDSLPAAPWHALPEEEVARQIVAVDLPLAALLERGLSQAEVIQRQKQYGPNELKAKAATPAWVKFLQQFNQSLLYILMVAGAVKAFLGSWRNAIVIWAVVVINALIGYIQESKAEEAIAALAQSVVTEVTVIREGQKLRVPSRELVPGDVVLLSSGDKVPADLRLLSVRNLQVDESALTGESVPVEKRLGSLAEDTPLADRQNMAYAGSFVTFGQGAGVVVAIGNQTQTGRISELVEKGGSLQTPLTRKFEEFSLMLLRIILSLAGLTFLVGLAQGQGAASVFEAAVALAVSAIPEGLPAVVTVTLAIGVSRMAKRHAIIRKLPAAASSGLCPIDRVQGSCSRGDRLLQVLGLPLLLWKTESGAPRSLAPNLGWGCRAFLACIFSLSLLLPLLLPVVAPLLLLPTPLCTSYRPVLSYRPSSSQAGNR